MEDSKIQWTNNSFNPWIGCAKVSAGCKNCYAENLMDKRYGKAQWGVNGTRVRTSDNYWKQPLRWNKRAQLTGIRERVFCASLADVFEDFDKAVIQMALWRSQLFELIEQTPFLDWQLLTKRPENIRNMLPKSWHKFPDNVWLGTSVENQEQADIRIPQLLSVPAEVRFLSMEPLLGPVDLWSSASYPLPDGGVGSAFAWGSGINWVIVGGESGHGARPMKVEWVRSLRDQCKEAGVPYFFKQFGEWLPFGQEGSYEGPTLNEYPSDGEAWKVGKHAAGRMLDGKTYDEFPLTSPVAL